MNATLESRILCSEDDIDISESDSDSNSSGEPDFYQPISAIDDEESDEAGSESSSDPHLSNGYRVNQAENAVSSLSLNDAIERTRSEEEDEERMREASDSAIRMAFREDETRRNAPLSSENAMRIMEAMRGVSIHGGAPDWARIVSEESWIDQLRRIRQPSGNSPGNFRN